LQPDFIDDGLPPIRIQVIAITIKSSNTGIDNHHGVFMNTCSCYLVLYTKKRQAGIVTALCKGYDRQRQRQGTSQFEKSTSAIRCIHLQHPVVSKLGTIRIGETFTGTDKHGA